MVILLLYRVAETTDYKLLCICYYPAETLDLQLVDLQPIKEVLLRTTHQGRAIDPLPFYALEWFVPVPEKIIDRAHRDAAQAQ